MNSLLLRVMLLLFYIICTSSKCSSIAYKCTSTYSNGASIFCMYSSTFTCIFNEIIITYSDNGGFFCVYGSATAVGCFVSDKITSNNNIHFRMILSRLYNSTIRNCHTISHDASNYSEVNFLGKEKTWQVYYWWVYLRIWTVEFINALPMEYMAWPAGLLPTPLFCK